MTDLYNTTLLEQSTTLGDIVTVANNASSGLDGGVQVLLPLFLIALWVIMIMILRKYELKSAILSTSFVMMIISLFLWQAQLVMFIMVLFFAFVFSAMALLLFISGQN